MNDNGLSAGAAAMPASIRRKLALYAQMRNFFLVVAGLVFAFGKVLYDWLIFTLDSELYSYCVLIPVVSGYLAWRRRKQIIQTIQPFSLLALIPGLGGITLLALWWVLGRSQWGLAGTNYLVFMLFAFWLLVLGAVLSMLGAGSTAAIAFPLAFLLLMAPLPTPVNRLITAGLQYGSAEVAHWLLKLSGMPVLRTDMLFELPGFRMEVAPQCSGIHSTLVLVIVSIVASHVFLQKPGNRVLLVLAVVPLALFRNGLRIFTIGNLCVTVSPDMISSYIHKQGGPIFFALSLIPFFLLLLALRKFETGRAR